MPNNNINISIDYLKIQGARKVSKDGKEYVLIDIAASRAKPFQRKDGSESIFGEFDVKANRDGEDKFKKTHFVAEATTKEEREAKTRMPIIGNGKEFVFGGSSSSGQTSRPQRPSPQAQTQDSLDEQDCIPF